MFLGSNKGYVFKGTLGLNTPCVNKHPSTLIKVDYIFVSPSSTLYNGKRKSLLEIANT